MSVFVRPDNHETQGLKAGDGKKCNFWLFHRKRGIGRVPQNPLSLQVLLLRPKKITTTKIQDSCQLQFATEGCQLSLSSLFVLAGVRHGPDTSQSAVCRRRPRTGKVPQNQPSLQVLFFRRAIHCMLEIDFDFILILTLFSVFFSVFSFGFFDLALFLVTKIFLAPAALKIRKTALSHFKR